MKSFFSKLGLKNRKIWAWVAYDWANSAFATSVMVVLLPIYFTDVAAATLPLTERTALWGYTSAISIAFVAIFSPLLGALADIVPWKKLLLGLFVILGSASCLGLYFVDHGDWMLAATLYTLGTIGFAGGNVFYESLLPHICSNEEFDRVSVAGYALGYLGGGVLLAVHLLWITKPELFGIIDKTQAVKLALASVGLWWFLFAIPLFVYVQEPQIPKRVQTSAFIAIRSAASQLFETLRSIAGHRQILLFLAAFYFYSDGIGTVMKMSTIYGRELGIEQGHLIGAMLLVQFLGVPCTFIFGPIAKSWGTKNGIIFCLGVYIVVCIMGYYMSNALHFWMLAVGVALVQGGCQALSRSLFASITPKEKSAEYFGFYSVSSKFAGIAGPLLFGYLAKELGHSRYSILFVVIFFIIGISILTRLNLTEAKADLQHMA